MHWHLVAIVAWLAVTWFVLRWCRRNRRPNTVTDAWLRARRRYHEDEDLP